MLHTQLHGTHWQIGFQLGAGLARDGHFILDAVPFPITPARLEFARTCLPLCRRWFPAALEELRGRIDYLFDTGVITAEAMNFMRGRSITDTWLVIDEAQNLTPRQVKGIITRVGKGTKVVLLGDPAQIDHPLLDTRSNGLTYASARMKGSPLCVQLTMLPDECERSSLALDAAMRM